MHTPKKIVLLSLLATFSFSTLYAATITPLWEVLDSQLSTYQMKGSTAHKTTRHHFSQNSPYQLSLMYQNKTNGIVHQRFQTRYKGLDVFGYHTLLHHYPNNKIMVTGHLIKGIEKEISSTLSPFRAPQILSLALKHLSLAKEVIKLPSTQKIIFVNPKTGRANLAYLVSFFTKTPRQPMLIIDALTGNVLKQWDNMKTVKLGEGPGGNNASPRGALNYVSSPSGSGNLPSFDIRISGSTKNLDTPDFEVRDYDASDSSIFPISIALEGTDGPATSYSYTTLVNDNVSQSVTTGSNTNLSPNNDVMFHAGTTLDMLKTVYGLSSPIGTDVPLRIYTRVQSLDNAFSIDTLKTGDTITSHQQLVIGNGQDFFFPLSMGTVAHELCHNVTSNHSNMVYAEQSGGMNEAFSDMCELTLYQYIRDQGYTWYWDGSSYNIGRNEAQSGNPLRYFNLPELDGNSIGSANDYNDSLDVHYSSGVYNKAFYLLASTYGLGIQKTFQYMGNANYNYWVPFNTFAYGACGVIQSAYDAKADHTQIIKAFKDVDVECKLFKLEKQILKH